ncbi:MAG: hypothetical protein ACFUZC_18925 [Chthoniobacteraceae bacterium]
MRVFPRLLVIGLLWGGIYYLFQHVKGMQSAEDVDNATLSSYYMGIVLAGLVSAIISGILLLPVLGEFMGNVIFSPSVEIEKSPHSAALAKLAVGDYEGAVEAYKEVFDDDPKDMHAANEIVRLYCEKLGTPEPASDFLVGVLSASDLTPEERAFFSERFVDICWGVQRDAVRANAILSKIVEEMPETREAANATHRMAEIERQAQEEAYLAAQQQQESEAARAVPLQGEAAPQEDANHPGPTA